MPKFNVTVTETVVHVVRGVEAQTPEQAEQIASQRVTESENRYFDHVSDRTADAKPAG